MLVIPVVIFRNLSTSLVSLGTPHLCAGGPFSHRLHRLSADWEFLISSGWKMVSWPDFNEHLFLEMKMSIFSWV